MENYGMEKVEPINTVRLEIRMIEPEDSENLYRYRSLPKTYQYQSFRPKNIDEVNSFIAGTESYIDIPDSWVQLVILLKGTNTFIGDIGLHFLDDVSQVEIGYTLDPLYQGKGYAIEAMKAVMAYLFRTLQKHRIIASVDPQNERSVHLLEKLKMRKEAHFIKSYRVGDEYGDDCIYAMLKEEYE